MAHLNKKDKKDKITIDNDYVAGYWALKLATGKLKCAKRPKEL